MKGDHRWRNVLLPKKNVGIGANYSRANNASSSPWIRGSAEWPLIFNPLKKINLLVYHSEIWLWQGLPGLFEYHYRNLPGGFFWLLLIILLIASHAAFLAPNPSWFRDLFCGSRSSSLVPVLLAISRRTLWDFPLRCNTSETQVSVTSRFWATLFWVRPCFLMMRCIFFVICFNLNVGWW